MLLLKLNANANSLWEKQSWGSLIGKFGGDPRAEGHWFGAWVAPFGWQGSRRKCGGLHWRSLGHLGRCPRLDGYLDGACTLLVVAEGGRMMGEGGTYLVLLAEAAEVA